MLVLVTVNDRTSWNTGYERFRSTGWIIDNMETETITFCFGNKFIYKVKTIPSGHVALRSREQNPTHFLSL